MFEIHLRQEQAIGALQRVHLTRVLERRRRSAGAIVISSRR
jgi:hypothetical protein